MAAMPLKLNAVIFVSNRHQDGPFDRQAKVMHMSLYCRTLPQTLSMLKRIKHIVSAESAGQSRLKPSKLQSVVHGLPLPREALFASVSA